MGVGEMDMHRSEDRDKDRDKGIHGEMYMDMSKDRDRSEDRDRDRDKGIREGFGPSRTAGAGPRAAGPDGNPRKSTEIHGTCRISLWTHCVDSFYLLKNHITPASNPNSNFKTQVPITSASTPSVIMKRVRRQRHTSCRMF